MQQLTNEGQQFVQNITSRYNLSFDAVIHMLISVQNGGGSMAQFNCPELGGGGQWMRGGMTMVGDMFNYGLKSTVDNLCNELSNGLNSMQIFPIIPPNTKGSLQWWPQELGSPFSQGGQNNSRYAIFPNRLAVDNQGEITVYNTLDHQIGGVSQQQGGSNSLTFSSQYGTLSVNVLPIISKNGQNIEPNLTNFATTTAAPTHQEQNMNNPGIPNEPPVQNANIPSDMPVQQTHPNPPNTSPTQQKNPTANQLVSSDEVITLIEKLGKLREAGILTDDEFNLKKTDLLNRL